jgi:Holliday junction DNA helicase RuvA
MFYYISGKLAHLTPSFAVVEANGVGYKLTISGTTHASMPHRLTTDEPPTVKLYTYMAVREDGIELFGFISEEELDSFKLLITVSGVGPKAAISILSELTPTKLAIAICSDDKKAISRANGVGPKSAARIVLELKDKLKGQSFTETEGSLPAEEFTTIGVTPSGKRKDAEDALTVLGYSRNEASAVLRTIDVETLEIDEIIRLALKKLMR